ncbi:hypothetical protein H2203_002022 [Taxawa tesnikishii (nom. ined.)]|nr:hypothetical protein H2203_002022 [Dothideales sp. JES 119]
MSTSKVSVSGASLPANAALHNALSTALIASSSIPTIQTALLNELQASGWTANLREYVTRLMRSGECTKYDDLMDRVLQEALGDLNQRRGRGEFKKEEEGEEKKVNGDGKDNGLRIPEQAVREGVKIVKRELERVCEVVDK